MKPWLFFASFKELVADKYFKSLHFAALVACACVCERCLCVKWCEMRCCQMILGGHSPQGSTEVHTNNHLSNNCPPRVLFVRCLFFHHSSLSSSCPYISFSSVSLFLLLTLCFFSFYLKIWCFWCHLSSFYPHPLAYFFSHLKPFHTRTMHFPFSGPHFRNNARSVIINYSLILRAWSQAMVANNQHI